MEQKKKPTVEEQEQTQPEENGEQTKEKTFTQAEVNKIVSERLSREREKNETIYTQALVNVEARENAIAEKEKAFAEKEKALLDKENRLFAIKAMKEAGIDDGSNTAFDIVDFIVAGDNVTQESITKKVSALKSYLDKRIATEINNVFKANGRSPQGATSAANCDEDSSLKSAFGLA